MTLEYVRRCKTKSGFDRHLEMHAADNGKTLCGKELNEMWFIETSAGKNISYITCRWCRDLLPNPEPSLAAKEDTK